MSYKFVPFEAWHMKAFAMVDSVDGFNVTDIMQEQECAALERFTSWSLIDEDNDVVACGGLVPQWKGRYTAWMYITRKASKCMLRITRLVKAVLDDAEGRVEMTVRKDFSEGHRWAKLLGFEVENPPGILKQYGPFGEDHISYVRIN